MRKAILFVSIWAAAACTHIQIVGFDKQEDTVAIQAKRATMDQIQTKADEYCGDHAELLSMDKSMAGARTTAGGSPNFASADTAAISNRNFGSANTSITNRYIYHFSCRKGRSAQK